MNGDKKHDLVSYRLKRARETLSEVQLHIDNEIILNPGIKRSAIPAIVVHLCYITVNR